MIINNLFNIAQIVYLKTDKDQAEYIIDGIIVQESGLQYSVKKGSESGKWVYGFELNAEIDTLKKVL